MTVDTTTPRTRRALLAATLGAIGATAASMLGRPAPVLAGTDGDVVLGQTNTTSTPTRIHNSTTASVAIEGRCQHGTGVLGMSTYGMAVWGSTTEGIGVWGKSSTYLGVAGESNSHHGVVGDSNAADRAAVLGRSYGDATGIHGASGTGPGSVGWVTAKPKTGVFGEARQDSDARGVWGYSPAGRGVYGQATTGQGVRGHATTGTAVYGTSADPMKGYALRAVGRVRFDNCAGVTTIVSGTKSKTVAPGIDLTSTSAVVATLQGSAGGTTTVHRVSVDTSTDTFTIHLTANASANVKVAWIVLG